MRHTNTTFLCSLFEALKLWRCTGFEVNSQNFEAMQISRAPLSCKTAPLSCLPCLASTAWTGATKINISRVSFRFLFLQDDQHWWKAQGCVVNHHHCKSGVCCKSSLVASQAKIVHSDMGQRYEQSLIAKRHSLVSKALRKLTTAELDQTLFLVVCGLRLS